LRLPRDDKPWILLVYCIAAIPPTLVRTVLPLLVQHHWSRGGTMSVRNSLLCFGALVLMTGAATAKPAYVASTVNLRAAPGTGSDIVAKIPGGSLVDASACDGGWCEIAWQDKRGFAIQSALDMSGRVPQQRAAAAPRPAYRQGPGVIEGPEVVEGPVYYDPPAVVYYGGPYYRPYYRSYWGWRRW
jgi:uncharacterized protein YraI